MIAPQPKAIRPLLIALALFVSFGLLPACGEDSGSTVSPPSVTPTPAAE